MSKSNGSHTVGRSAITGRFVTPATVARHPRTTVTQTVPNGRKGKSLILGQQGSQTATWKTGGERSALRSANLEADLPRSFAGFGPEALTVGPVVATSKLG